MLEGPDRKDDMGLTYRDSGVEIYVGKGEEIFPVKQGGGRPLRRWMRCRG